MTQNGGSPRERPSVGTTHSVQAGRKPSCESRAEEFRQHLSAWKRSIVSRPSLRALARELGTSHQLLCHYLKTWLKWEARDYRRRASEIRARARIEHRHLTSSEQLEATEYDRAALRETITDSIESMFKGLLKKVKAGNSPSKSEMRFVRIAAKNGVGSAARILDLCGGISAKNRRDNLPAVRVVVVNSFRSGPARLATPLKRAPALTPKSNAGPQNGEP